MAGEGMKMLVQHLKEYKDSTSAEIQYLKSKIKALKEQHELVSEEIEEREEQIEEHDRIINNLQSVNSRKYRAEERSDWQTLVESLNEDRDYLNKDLQDIEAATNIFVEETSDLNKRIEARELEAEELKRQLAAFEPEQSPPVESTQIADGAENDSSVSTPGTEANNGTSLPSSLPTPSQARYTSLIQQHRENHDLHTRLLQERQAAQDEDADIQRRVQKQREELHSLRAENQQLLLATQRLGPGAASGNANSVSNAGASSSGVTSQLRKLLRLCGRPDDHPLSLAAKASSPFTSPSASPRVGVAAMASIEPVPEAMTVANAATGDEAPVAGAN